MSVDCHHCTDDARFEMFHDRLLGGGRPVCLEHLLTAPPVFVFYKEIDR